jgi:hypothetical protein
MAKFMPLSLCLLSLLSCATSRNELASRNSVFGPACKSQEFLSKNGFLDGPPTLRREEIFLELWDRLNYAKNGEVDWDAMFKDRLSSFTGRLYGIQLDSEGDTVFYRMEKGFRCVFVDKSPNGAVHLNEANCQPTKKTVRRVAVASLKCKS